MQLNFDWKTFSTPINYKINVKIIEKHEFQSIFNLLIRCVIDGKTFNLVKIKNNIDEKIRKEFDDNYKYENFF